MAMTTRELRIKARKLGAANVREMSQDELEEYIAENTNGSNGKKGKKVGRKATLKAVKKAGKRGPGRPRKVEVEDDDEDEDEVVEAPRRGRPKGSKNKTTAKAAKRGRPAKTEARNTKTSSKKRSGSPGRPPGSGTGTRVLLPDVIDWEEDFDFREGTTQQYILTQIRKVAEKYEDTGEIRTRVYDKLADKIGTRDELTFMNRETGKAHKADIADQRLKYIISRTMFDFANNTGQHEGAGTSSASQPRNGSAKKAKAKTSTTGKNNVKRGRGRPRKVVEDDDDEEEAPKRRGRPPGSKSKTGAKRGPGRPRKTEAVAEKRGPGRPRKDDSAPKRRGRPPGSKNKKYKVRA